MSWYIEFQSWHGGPWKRLTTRVPYHVPGVGPYKAREEAEEAIIGRAKYTSNHVRCYRAVEQRDTIAPPAGPENGIPAQDVKAMAPQGDMKAALRGGVKPDLTHVRTPLLNYIARACEYGNDKYERSNYLRQTASLSSDFERLRAYLRAAVSHILQTLDAMEAHQATDPKLEDKDGMKKAAFAVDSDPDKTGKVGPSMLPHLCGAAASLMMAITQATNAGLLPADPGTPWRK